MTIFLEYCPIEFSYFYTTNKELDSLYFNADSAICDLDESTLKIFGIPFIKVAENFEYKFDYEKIKEFNLHPDILNIDYKQVNTPLGFLDKHRQFVDFVLDKYSFM